MRRPHRGILAGRTALGNTVFIRLVKEAIRIVCAHEYDSLGEEFEEKEHQLFGDDGFEKMVDRIASIEKSLGIYDLAQFTPQV